MKKVLFAIAMVSTVLGFTSCEEDEKITPKDYGMKTFEADLKYSSVTDPETGYPSSTYAQQTYFAFDDVTPEVATGLVDTDSWTQFNVYTPAEDEYPYNDESDVEGWDLVFTNYRGTTYDSEGTASPYNLTGVLFNTSEDIMVAEMTYDDSETEDDISAAFAALTLSDVSALDYSDDIQTIGADWKVLNFATFTYDVYTNNWFIVKLNNGDHYKLRIVSFYGDTTDERIITMEYALMQ